MSDAAGRPCRDPRPPPPREPALDECCGTGCDPCVFDVYDAARDRYRAALQAWVLRHPDAGHDAQVPE